MVEASASISARVSPAARAKSAVPLPAGSCDSKERQRIRLLHIIPDLWTGGAETMLAQLIAKSDRAKFEHQVLSLRSVGDVGPTLREHGVTVDALGVHAWSAGLLKLPSFRHTIQTYRPHVVHTWLYHANVVGGAAARLWSDAKLVWGLHCGPLDIAQVKYRTRLMRWLGGRMSGPLPDRIICCAHSVEAVHAELGYARQNLTVIPNGVDVARFHPDPRAREALRAELGIGAGEFLVGWVGRYDPQKDYATFLDAARAALDVQPNLRFLLCGRGFEADRGEVTRALAARGLLDRFIRLGFRTDVPRVMAALDAFALSSSYGEAFPLVIIEAMATGLPVVATDVGDTRTMIEGCGITVPPRAPAALAAGIVEVARLPAEDYRTLQDEARERVATMFSLEAAVGRHEALYREVLGRQLAVVPERGLFSAREIVGQK
ncbi:MAG TPA: glycosyltransferase [Stellaceae bacterium]|nr:glycosyltransferase [Stellaceae bacterium]